MGIEGQLRSQCSKEYYWYTRVADVSNRYEDLEWVVLVRFPNTAFYVSLYFCLTFFSVTWREGQKLLLTAQKERTS
jgi:hypothetical protein